MYDYVICFLLFSGKVLIVGGGIANFTNVAATFKVSGSENHILRSCDQHMSRWRHHFQGIVRALRSFQQQLIDGKVRIYVRRAGPNYQEGLRIMRELGIL